MNPIVLRTVSTLVGAREPGCRAGGGTPHRWASNAVCGVAESHAQIACSLLENPTQSKQHVPLRFAVHHRETNYPSHIHTHTRTRTQAHRHTFSNIRAYAHIQTCIHTITCTPTQIYGHTRMIVHIGTYVCTRARAHVHTHTHTHQVIRCNITRYFQEQLTPTLYPILVPCVYARCTRHTHAADHTQTRKI